MMFFLTRILLNRLVRLFGADKGKAPMPRDLEIPAEFLCRGAARPRQRREENRQVAVGQQFTGWRNLAQDDERKKRALAELRYRALKGKPLKQSEVTKMMRNLVKNQWCAAHNGTITMERWSRNPAITEPPSKRQRVERASSQPSDVSAATTTKPASNGFCCFRLELGDFSISDSDNCMSRIAADPASEDEVLAEILFRGQYVSGAGVVVVDKLPDDEIVDPRVKVEPISESASSPPRSRSKHRGVRSDTSLWDRPVDDFLSSESESDDDIEDYIPPIPYGAFKDWEIVRCPLRNTYYHVYYQDNRRHKNFFYLKELLPHVYREDLLLLRRRMNRYFRLNPDVDVGLDLWRDVNLLCQSLHSDDVEDFWRTQDEWVVSGWRLYPKSSVHVLDLTHGKTVYMFVDKFYPIRAPLLERMLHHRLTVPPSYCRDVVVAGRVIQTIQDGLRESYECLASAPIVDMVINPPGLYLLLGAKDWTGPEQTATRDVAASFDSAVHRVHAVSFDAAVASIVSAACCAAADYVVYCCAFLVSCCSSILLAQEGFYLETWN
ncbi:hypothetical protein Tco_0038549 [Tanacetum coccineum]|uniref:Uncharacterized protein n=1 Tax=Tanacetum coccineum TaxID=301880 RepID=A0ABQ5ELY5_9ASTR